MLLSVSADVGSSGDVIALERPEHRIRLANYGFWCRAGCQALRRVLQLSFLRLARFHRRPEAGGRQCDILATDLQRGKEYTVLYSTGPDVVTEGAFGARDPGNEGAPGRAQLRFPFAGYDRPPSPLPLRLPPHYHYHLRYHNDNNRKTDHQDMGSDTFQGVLGDGSMFADPQNLLVNINAFTWRGTFNEALYRDW